MRWLELENMVQVIADIKLLSSEQCLLVKCVQQDTRMYYYLYFDIWGMGYVSREFCLSKQGCDFYHWCRSHHRTGHIYKLGQSWWGPHWNPGMPVNQTKHVNWFNSFNHDLSLFFSKLFKDVSLPAHMVLCICHWSYKLELMCTMNSCFLSGKTNHMLTPKYPPCLLTLYAEV